VLQNNGSAAHQAVNHVHFHIIGRFADTGLDLGWKAGRLDDRQAQEIAGKIREALGND
jgi:histidine triad (HIT) family protein